MSGEMGRFRKPPVDEVAIGVQFEPLPGFSGPHAGLYWESLGPEWTKVQEAPRLDDQFEKFGGDRHWAIPMFAVKSYEPGRVQIIRADDERVIQIQNSRFICNWRKRSATYPTFETLFPEFEKALEGFRAFARENEFPEPAPNQWELTYVNRLLQGELWTTPAEWSKIFPGFFVPSANHVEYPFEAFTGAWQFVVGKNLGRLHVNLGHGKLAESTSGQEVLTLVLTARGPVDESKGLDVAQGLRVGHEAIVQTFTSITSDTAHAAWERVE